MVPGRVKSRTWLYLEKSLIIVIGRTRESDQFTSSVGGRLPMRHDQTTTQIRERFWRFVDTECGSFYADSCSFDDSFMRIANDYFLLVGLVGRTLTDWLKLFRGEFDSESVVKTWIGCLCTRVAHTSLCGLGFVLRLLASYFQRKTFAISW